MSTIRQLLLILILILLSPPSSAVDFIFNGFIPSDLSLYGNSTFEPSGDRRRYLSLTSASTFSLGRALYKSRISARSNSSALPFFTSFIFSITTVPSFQPGHGLAFLFAPAAGTLGATSAQHLGLFNFTTNDDPSGHVLAVEFDVFQNQEFHDINGNHVGIDRNSLTSIAANAAGFWDDGRFVNLTLNDGSNYQVWIDYLNRRLNITMAPANLGKKPLLPLISIEIDLSDLFLDEMYIGFCAATGKMVERHHILAWSFSNSNVSVGDGLITSNLPNFIPVESLTGNGRSRALAIGLSMAAGVILLFAFGLFYFLCLRPWWQKRKIRRGIGDEVQEPVEDWELQYWPHRISYGKILAATGRFSNQNLIGAGGIGRVYRGVLDGAAVAVKFFFHNNSEETRQFLAEVSTLGRLKHRNLVGLRGWCRTRRRHTGGEQMLLVYDYMENGSLDRRIFASQQEKLLGWKERVGILRNVAAAVHYLHEGWREAVVLHRDIKASNVLLDGEMTARLGDFGLARAHPHGAAVGTTKVVGTAGYMAPELLRTGRASPATDVYAFGVVVLEVVCGRRAAVEGLPPLVAWVRASSAVVEKQLGQTEVFEEEEAETLVRLAVACTCEDPAGRPTMREVVRALEWERGVSGSDDGGYGDEAWLLLEKKITELSSPASKGRSGGAGGGGCGNAGVRRLDNLTFEELRQSLSSSISLSETDLNFEGR